MTDYMTDGDGRLFLARLQPARRHGVTSPIASRGLRGDVVVAKSETTTWLVCELWPGGGVVGLTPTE
jgi:hypothetical protein